MHEPTDEEQAAQAEAAAEGGDESPLPPATPRASKADS